MRFQGSAFYRISFFIGLLSLLGGPLAWTCPLHGPRFYDDLPERLGSIAYFHNLKANYLQDAIAHRKVGLEIEFVLPGDESRLIDVDPLIKQQHLDRIVQHVVEEVFQDRVKGVSFYWNVSEVPESFRSRITAFPFYLVQLKNDSFYHFHFDEQYVEISAPPFYYQSPAYRIFLEIVRAVYALGYQGASRDHTVSLQVNVDMEYDATRPLHNLLKHWKRYRDYWIQHFSPFQKRMDVFLYPISDFIPEATLERTLGKGDWFQFYTELQYLMNVNARRDNFDLSLKPLFHIWLDLILIKDKFTKGRNAVEMRLFNTPDAEDPDWQLKLEDMIEASLSLVEAAHQLP